LALKLFPGWLTYAAYPFWIISIISTSVIFFLSAYFLKQYPNFILENSRQLFLLGLLIGWLLIIMFIYRSALIDTHETVRLLIYKVFSKFLKLSLTENIEYIIYRGKLAVYESARLKVETRELIKFLISIEDRDYFSHSGLSYRAILRSLLGQLGIKSKSGGSKIIQQLVRTLFIRELNKTYRRKFFEWGLAPWLNSVLSKDMILQIYLSSVRYEKGKYGVIEAMEYFWGSVKHKPSPAQAFFLIERVSNIRSRLLVNKIVETAKNAKEIKYLSTADMAELFELYKMAVKGEKIKADEAELSKLSSLLK
jgi:penicillin-binding protein 1A